RDKTLDIINRYRDRIFRVVAEPDKNHFDAMNKGIKLATGDIVGFLHADDFFVDDRVVEKVVDTFKKTNADCLWGDLVYVDKNNTEKVIRYWRSCEYRDGFFKKGWMPPHPAFFAKKQVYEKYGYFDTDLEISADYEIMLRFLHKYRISTGYLPEVLVRMRLGGLSNSSLKNVVRKSREDLKAWKLNDLKGRVPAVFLKNISKIPQFFVK
ncbi:MAG: glycosyltransferase, partial [Candidatus Omnitrophica bacterium]|nr:glycosyltransferase [Candidatus Omnitrophota bacterium]